LKKIKRAMSELLYSENIVGPRWTSLAMALEGTRLASLLEDEKPRRGGYCHELHIRSIYVTVLLSSRLGFIA
jgi:hypothetical protein